MSNRRTEAIEGGGSGTDIMTSLIGCLILILLGILMIVFVSQVLVMITEPDNKEILSVVESKVDGFRESKAFPDGNLFREPTYIDVHQNKIVIHPGEEVVTQRELYQKQNAFFKLLDEIKGNHQNESIILLVRPRAAGLKRYLQQIVKEDYKLDLGVELYESAREVEHVSSTRELLKKQQADAAKKTKEARALGGKALKNDPAPEEPKPAQPVTP